jgi:DNA-binding CsgD family transcriptional regulator
MDEFSQRHRQPGTAPMELVGRQLEIRQLRLFVGLIAQGAGEALLLSGDPGVGKSSLLDFTADLATDAGIRLLRATGSQFEAGIVAKADAGLSSLTPQQRQIALLAAAGHTNKEIAARLFLSPRTVSTHLYQVFPKLGITSRAALRDALGDLPPE